MSADPAQRPLQADLSRLEERLRQVEDAAEEAVLDARMQETQRLQSLGDLAGAVAHDLNNLLGGILNYATLAADGIRDRVAAHGLEGDPELALVQRDLHEISRVTNRAVELTHRLLAFGRREVPRPEALDLNALVRDLAPHLQGTLGELIRLDTVLGTELPEVEADPGHVEQVLRNLVANARDAMPEGGRLEIRTAVFDADDDFSRLHAVAPGRYVRLTVSDTGLGMAPDVKARAFEPLFTTKHKGIGAGMGLATVYGIVSQAGGHVAIYSEASVGTTVRVDLPVVASEEAPGAESGGPAAAASGETVLLVEDEVVVREPARRMLARHGYSVLSTSSVHEALRVAREHGGDVSLLLTDVEMPDGSARDLAREISRFMPRTKVLFMSGHSPGVIRDRGLLDRDVALIEKPFAATALLSRVRQVLDGKP